MPGERGNGVDAERAGLGAFILRLRKRGITDTKVLTAIESVPRSIFAPPGTGGDVYSEAALPIECGQTISSPDIVGIMTSALEAGPDDRVLEVGTGSGYQTAVLARLARRVYTVDRFRTLVETALSRFHTLRLTNVVTMVGDGMLGWPEEAPFDRIIVTAAGEKVPQALLDQLKPGGILVAPVGPLLKVQQLMRMKKTDTGWDETNLGEVRFVPLIPGKASRL